MAVSDAATTDRADRSAADAFPTNSLFAAALGIFGYTSLLAADALETSYLRNASESKMYAGWCGG